MAGSTTNLDLYLPGGGSTNEWTPDEVADIDPLNNNFKKIDDWAGVIGNRSNRNFNFRGPAASIGAVPSPQDGDTYQETNGSKRRFLRVDGAWVQEEKSPYAMAAGTVDITPSAPNTPTGVSVTFPAGRFSRAPFVWVSPRTASPGTLVTGCSAGDETTSGATIYLTRTTTTTTPVRWLAVQMKSDATAG